MNRSMPGLPVHHHLPDFTQTHVHRVRDAIQPSHPRSSLSPLIGGWNETQDALHAAEKYSFEEVDWLISIV